LKRHIIINYARQAQCCYDTHTLTPLNVNRYEKAVQYEMKRSKLRLYIKNKLNISAAHTNSPTMNTMLMQDMRLQLLYQRQRNDGHKNYNKRLVMIIGVRHENNLKTMYTRSPKRSDTTNQILKQINTLQIENNNASMYPMFILTAEQANEIAAVA
jgi:hypothetical protein